ncbi:MAG: hypothetical protein HFE76_14095 [Firmicutes bacterium]|nr:hypothetical protein [Bacillota bacterium]
MIRLTQEQREKNRALRHEIMDRIMEIQDTESLEFVRSMARCSQRKELTEHVLQLDEFIELIDIKQISTIYQLFVKDEEPYFAKDQVLELCKDAIDRHIQFGGSISELTEDMV